MSEQPPGGPPIWAPPPPPPPPPPEPPPFAPSGPPEGVVAVQQPPYWTPQPAAPVLRARRGPNLVALISVAAAVLLLIVAIAGYVVIGNGYASSRISAADDAIAQVHEIDFDAALTQISGGFSFASTATFDEKGFASRVATFASALPSENGDVASEGAKLQSALTRLGESEWLTALERSDVDGASRRAGHAQNALAKAQEILADFAQDGRFYTAYAATLSDVAAWSAAAQSSDVVQVIAKVEQAKTDVGQALLLDGAPGLAPVVHQYLQDFQAVVTDYEAAFNADLQNNKAAFDAAEAKAKADNATIVALDMSGVDGAVAAFYQPFISAYKQELSLASS